VHGAHAGHEVVDEPAPISSSTSTTGCGLSASQKSSVTDPMPDSTRMRGGTRHGPVRLIVDIPAFNTSGGPAGVRATGVSDGRSANGGYRSAS
jgi:hypothetical protein